jgi:predicted permease
MVGDVRYGLHSFGRAPALAAAIVATLALGLGATAAIVSVVNAVLLRPLPYADADRLVTIVENVPAEESFSGVAMRMTAMSTDDFEWWRTSSQSLSHLAVMVPEQRTLASQDGTDRLAGMAVSAALFAMRRVPPVLGRGLVDLDEQPGAGVVVLAEATWRAYFAADPNVVGRSVSLDGMSHTIVGVMPAAFGVEAYWLPFDATPAQPGTFRLLPVTARLRDGVSLETASAEVNLAGHRLRGLEPDFDAPPRFELVRELDQLTASVAPALRVLVASVALLLLIVCANVANLLLVRGMGRHAELAVRRALGATRGRIVRQVLTESLLLAAAGGAIGVSLAHGSVAALKALGAAAVPERFANNVGPDILPRLAEIAIDGGTLAFIAGLALASAALFGVLPALRLARVGEEAPPARAQRPAAIRATFAGHALATAQLSLAVTLLIGAGLLLHSFVKLAAVDLGFDSRGVLTFELVVPGDYSPERKLQAAEDLVERLRAHPTVTRVGFTDIAPLTRGIALGGGLLPVGASEVAVKEDASLPVEQRAQQRYAGADYLRALGARLMNGRWLDEPGGIEAPYAALVSKPYVERYFRDSNPLGATIQTPAGAVTVVGVVDDLHLRGVEAEPERIVFVDPRATLNAIRASSAPYWDTPDANRFFLTLGTGSVPFAVRTTGNPLTLVADLRTLSRQIDSALAIDRVAPMDDVVGTATLRPRFFAVLLGVFAAVATLIAVIGVHGVLAYVVGRRSKEIGIRIALGAERRSVMRLVLRQGVAMTAIGLAVGLAGALGLTRFLDGMLFGLSTVDVATYGAVSVLFAAVALLASYLPARRATLIDPLVSLRHE